MSTSKSAPEGSVDQSQSPGPERVTDVETAKHDLRVLYAVLRDRRTKWYVPALMALVVLWGLSPVDALPDVFPIVGVLDEAIVFMLGRAAVYRVVPEEYIDEHAMNLANKSTRRYTAKHLIGGLIILQVGAIIAAVVLLGGVFFSL